MVTSQSQTSLSLERGLEQAEDVMAIAILLPLLPLHGQPLDFFSHLLVGVCHTEPQLVPVSLVLAEHAASA